jgi:hypothetical protein
MPASSFAIDLANSIEVLISQSALATAFQNITGVKHCYVVGGRRSFSMSNSLQQHGLHEINKQLRLCMKKNGLDTIEVLITRRAGKFKFAFTGSPEQVVRAEQILAAWA